MSLLPLCAVDPDHGDATRRAPIGYRVFHVCKSCARPARVDDPGPTAEDREDGWVGRGRRTPMRDRVERYLRWHPGATTEELSLALVGRGDGTSRARNAFGVLLTRMAKDGTTRRERVEQGREVYFRNWLANDRRDS